LRRLYRGFAENFLKKRRFYDIISGGSGSLGQYFGFEIVKLREEIGVDEMNECREFRLTESKSLSEAKRLYRSAFPKEEQVPFFVLRFLTLIKGVDLICYRENDNFCGFTYTVTAGNVVFVLFFAVNADLRGRGYGSAILAYLKEKNPDRSVILNVEPLDDEAENAEERIRRIRFYEKNGFFDTGYDIEEIGGTFRVLATEKEINMDEYLRVFGKMSFGLWKPKWTKVDSKN
jgi:GNAT superfamily N-acetyltransferase